jgi:chromosome segregation ATPase
MATLATQLFSREGSNTEDEEQLLKLFWNRAELKKELASLRNDIYQLSDQLKHEQALKLRVQQRYEQLETMLSSPATAATSVTYYQLRDVWSRCFERLAAISDDLSRVHHDKKYRQHVAGFRRELYKSLTGIQGELGEINQSGELLRSQIRMLREKRMQCQGVWNFFSRRRLTSAIAKLRADRRQITMRLGELTEDIQSRSSESPPEFAGLAIEEKRSINLTIIAYAQELYLHFADQEISIKAREAYIRQLSDIRYGDKHDCRSMSSYIEERIGLLEADRKLQDRVEMRAQHLGSLVSYRSDADAVPSAELLDRIILLKAAGKPCGSVNINVLADEYWDVFAVLLN